MTIDGPGTLEFLNLVTSKLELDEEQSGWIHDHPRSSEMNRAEWLDYVAQLGAGLQLNDDERDKLNAMGKKHWQAEG